MCDMEELKKHRAAGFEHLKWICLVDQTELHLYTSLRSCEFVEGGFYINRLHFYYNLYARLVETSSPEAASASLSLRCWL